MLGQELAFPREQRGPPRLAGRALREIALDLDQLAARIVLGDQRIRVDAASRDVLGVVEDRPQERRSVARHGASFTCRGEADQGPRDSLPGCSASSS